jgi:hypothetical protein
MKIKSTIAKPFANYIAKKIKKDSINAVADQEKILTTLIKSAKSTLFGKDHHFDKITDYNSFKINVPIRDYEQLKNYIDLVKVGKQNVLWKGRPIYFAKTSGTTSGMKYIPITKDSIGNHINTARNALLCYIAETGNNAFPDGKMIFLSGSPVLERVGDVPFGRLSGIVNHHIPKYLRSNQLPSYQTNCIEEWEEKVDAIVNETIDKDMRLISGIPPWMQMYFDKLIEKSGKKVGELFPNFSVMVQGGVNFEPYKTKLYESIGRHVDCIELFPASEGFFAFQDSQKEKGMLLNTNSGIFYEFIPTNELGNANPNRVHLKDVQLGENYALIINSNAGLWGYSIGDTIKFVSLNPYRLIVSGRIKHFISAFGEHIIGEEVENAILATTKATNTSIVEFTVAPFISSGQGKSYHEWFIEFEKIPNDLEEFKNILTQNMRLQNVYYKDLLDGNILQPLQLTIIQKNGFVEYMKSIGKLGGQNKVARLSNDRKIADELIKWVAK